MNRELDIHIRAYEDTAGLADYIEKDNPEAARRFIAAMFETSDFIAENPRAGSRVESDHPKLRNLRRCAIRGFRNYFIFYADDGRTIAVTRVLHGARDQPNALLE